MKFFVINILTVIGILITISLAGMTWLTWQYWVVAVLLLVHGVSKYIESESR